MLEVLKNMNTEMSRTWNRPLGVRSVSNIVVRRFWWDLGSVRPTSRMEGNIEMCAEERVQ
jgi:hypothetical protein